MPRLIRCSCRHPWRTRPFRNAEEIVVPPEIAAAASSRQRLISMPETWKRTATEVNGSVRLNYWHGVLHIYNQDGMRWATPFPPKRDHVYRVMIVGDSLTYGDGLAESRRFSNLLDRWMKQKFEIEFINLGVDGAQSEDLEIINKYLPVLRPDLVIYGVCVNDFLPSGRGKSDVPLAYPFPFPAGAKDFLLRDTLTGAFLSESYDGALRRLDLRGESFVEDILKGFNGNRQRFARDVAEMTRIVQAAGLPPLIAMVLVQYPDYGDGVYQMAKIAKSALRQAGAVVISTEDYFRRFNGQPMNISRWEGHPNEVANYIWASMIAKELLRDLRIFKK